MNRLTLAVAGGRKTQAVIDGCIAAAPGRRILTLTYTQANQREIRSRLAAHGPRDADVDVQGWFSFLMRHWVRPYLPRLFPGRRLTGLDFDGDPGRFATGERRFLHDDGRAFRLHLAKLAHDTNRASNGAVLDRLARIYDTIYIDEVQDLNGYDLEILLHLMDSRVDLLMLGDIRQALLATNVREMKNAKYKGIAIKNWFDEQEAARRLEVVHSSKTWRSNQTISDFADSIFNSTWGFPPTESQSHEVTGHDGLFVVRPADVQYYLDRYAPLCLRHGANSGGQLQLPYVNIGKAKGRSVDRVLIYPTKVMTKFIQTGEPLDLSAACSLYIAVTRARSSVAFITDAVAGVGLQRWEP